MKKKIINVIIIVVTLFACITGIKAATILATSVTYGDMTVQEALDELIEQANTLIDELQVQVGSNTNNINTLTTVVDDISNDVDELKNSSSSGNSNMRYNEETDIVQIYYDGVWLDWKVGGVQALYYIKNGVVDTSQSVSFTLSVGSSSYNSKGYLSFFTGSSEGHLIGYSTALDVTSYNKIYVDYYMISTRTDSSNDVGSIEISTVRGNSNYGSLSANALGGVTAALTGGASKAGTLEVDVSNATTVYLNLTGNAYYSSWETRILNVYASI